ncbi:MAG: hypothetical protein ACEQSM_03035 [Aliarcobacter sp.]
MKKLIGTLVISAALTSVLWPATIQSSFEDKYIGNEGRPSVGNGEFYAIGSGHLWYTWNGLTDPIFTADGSKAYEDLGTNGKIQFHQSASDPENQNYNASQIAFGYTRGGGYSSKLWDISAPVKSFSSYFQYYSGTGYGVFQLQYYKANYGLIASDTLDMRGVVDRWIEYSFSSEQSFDWINIDPIEGQFMPTILFDNVSFSTESVPEPSSFSLLVMFGLITAIGRNLYRNIIPLSSRLDEKNQREE